MGDILNSPLIRRLTIGAHLALAVCLGWIATAMIAGFAGTLGFGSAFDQELAALVILPVAVALVMVVLLLSGIRTWVRDGRAFRLVWVDLFAVVAAPIALIVSAFVTPAILVEPFLALACLVLVVIASRPAPARPATGAGARPGWRSPLAIALITAIPAAATIAAVSIPGGDLGLELFAVGLWLVAAPLWDAAFIEARRQGRATESGAGRAWALAPLVLVVTIGLTLAGAPVLVRFELSRTALETLPTQQLSLENSAVVAGSFEVSEYQATTFGYQFVVSDQDSVIYGFAYSPGGPPAGPDIDATLTDQDGYRHLDGPWYLWKYVRT